MKSHTKKLALNIYTINKKNRKRTTLARRKLAYMVLLALSLLVSMPVLSQAYCALRDPVPSINSMFPNHVAYRSLVKKIDDSIRLRVEAEINYLNMHFSELGRHTLYIISDEKGAQGIVHVRAEESPWGLVEIAYAFDLDLNLIDYRIQRCRSSAKKNIDNEYVRSELTPSNKEQLTRFLDNQGNLVKESIPNTAKRLQSDKDITLIEILLRCAIKTRVITEYVWGEEILHSKKQRLEAQVPAAENRTPKTTI